MIKVDVTTKNDVIERVKVTGHAGYADLGKDIVCASVSTMVITSVNAIYRFNSEVITVSKNDGFVQIVVNIHDDITDNLLENLVACLSNLAESYEKNIKIIYREVS